MYRDRQRELEQRVAERTHALRNEIAERERADLELIRAKEAAEAASRIKSEFLANMSHEIRTPMNGVIGVADLLLASNCTAEQREYLQIIKSSADTLLTIINDILDFSKVEAGKLDLDPIDFDLRKMLSETVKSLQLRALEKNLELSHTVDSTVPRIIHADPVRLRQVILNLLANAMKFTHAGSVLLRVTGEPQGLQECCLHFVVEDTGIGVDQTKLASIFNAFAQGDTATTRNFGGTGLGLTISSRLVSLMGGRIWVHSEPGKGSQFHFTVNVGVAAEQLLVITKTTPTAQPQRNLSLTVLLVEDNPVNRLVARVALQKAGFDVHEADNGAQALNKLRHTHFDVVLMDCRMPVMDGYEATREIRLLSGNAAKVPIIALTASALKEDEVKTRDAGMDDFLSKPFRPEELISKCLFWTHGTHPEWQEAMADDESMSGSEGSSAALICNLADIFLEAAPPVFENLVRSFENGNWTEVNQAAHWMQGGGVRVFSADLQQQLAIIEKATALEHCTIGPESLIALKAAFSAACASASEWRSSRRAPCIAV